MNRTTVFLLFLCLNVSGFAASPGPYYSQCAMLSRIAESASAASTRAAALNVLERVAGGTDPEIGIELEKQVGIPLADIHQPIYREVGVRACALRALGRTDLPDAIEFLKGVKPLEDPEDRSHRIWQAAQIGLREGLLNRITEPGPRADFLENILKEPHDAMSKTALIFWAVEELCNAGASAALPEIRKSLNWMWPEPRGEDAVRFCEARIEVLGRDSDRAKALGTVFTSVVSLESNLAGRDLLQWAASQLAAIHSPSADQELDRVANQLGTLARGFPSDVKLSKLVARVNGIREVRKR